MCIRDSGGGDQVTRVQANAAELLAGQFHAQAHGVVHVVGVDQQGRAGAEGTQLRLEGFALVVVQQGEGCLLYTSRCV